MSVALFLRSNSIVCFRIEMFRFVPTVYVQGDQKVSLHLTITIQYTIYELKMVIIEYIRNVDRGRSSRTQFGVSINVWRLAGDTLNIACNFLYCNDQVHRDFLITLYVFHTLQSSWLFVLSSINWLVTGTLSLHLGRIWVYPF